MNHEVLVVLDTYGRGQSDGTNSGATGEGDVPETEFLEWFVARKRDFRVTLLFLGGSPGAWLADMAGAADAAALERHRRAAQVKAQARLAAMSTRLAGSGFLPENLSTKLRIRDFGSLHDVLVEMASGLYDAVLLGKGGAARFWDMQDDPANLSMLRDTVEFPLWLCGEVEPDRRGVLVCVDGSAASDRAADHAGFMLDVAPDHVATVCSVASAGWEGQAVAHMERAMAQLTGNGVVPERVAMRLLHGDDPAAAIRAASEEGRFAAVCLGRTGADTRTRGNVFLGSTAAEIARGAGGATVWAVR